MLQERYGVEGTVEDILNVWENVKGNDIHAITNWDGSPVKPGTPEHVSIFGTNKKNEKHGDRSILLNKYRAVKGMQSNFIENISSFEKNVMELAPSITKGVFGGNLLLATSVVEYGMNALNEGIGHQNLSNFFRALFQPIARLTLEERREHIADLQHIIETLTSARAADLKAPHPVF